MSASYAMENQDSRAGRSAIPRRERLGPSLLSYAQERLWFIHQMEPESAFYNLPAALRLTGDLSISALHRSFKELVRRHAALRTTFTIDEGSPVQMVHQQSAVAFVLVDLENLKGRQKEAEARRIAEIEAGRPFDLVRGPLLRVALLRLEARNHVLLMTLHHIVSDAWSRGVLIGDIGDLYAAHRNGIAPVLKPLPIQYADYAAWQREWLRGEVLDRQLLYWKTQLAGAPVETGIPTDFPRPLVQRYRGGIHKWSIGPEQTRKLRNLSSRQSVTLFMTLLAGFQIMLARLGGQTDIVVGSPIANRNRREVEDLIGFFVNTLVLRVDLSGDPRFVDLLDRVRDMALSAYAHQDLPFEKLVEELQPQRDLGRNPLFQISFALHNVPSGSLRLPGLELDPFGEETASVRFDLEFNCYEANDRIEVVVYYSSDLFRHSTIARLITYYETVLGGITADPQQRIADVSLLPEAERARLLELSSRSHPSPAAHCLHTLFEAQAAGTPEATALVLEDAHLTYGALESAANRLASVLAEHEAGPEMLVGLYCERSLEMIVGILAILKSGAAYVPLDPQYPAERLRLIAADTKLKIVVAQKGIRENFLDDGVSVVHIENDLARAVDARPRNHNRVLPESPAYVIHTSGSTGMPKGVIVPHNNVVRLLTETQPWFSFSSHDRWTLFHSFAFDFSVWEIWGPLLNGGQLVIVPYWTSRSPGEFLDLIRREQITVLNQTPSAFRQLSLEESQWPPARTPIRYVIFGGEALDPGGLRPWLDRHGDLAPQLVNMYGITETTVHVTGRFLTGVDSEEGCRSLIGRHIRDLDLFVLSDGRQLTPEGTSGEIFVGGAGVARGYLNDPALTAERFVPHPFSQSPGERLYRSGDLARRTPDGDLEYLGRADSQVKIRGFRIDPAEVAAAIRRSPGVRDAVVAARAEKESGKRLVAWVVAAAAEGGLNSAGPETREKQLSHWRQVFDDNYQRPVDTDFNTSGWNSSYTNQPIPDREMKEWVDRTVERISRYGPGKVLEIGCGTGLLLHRLAPVSVSYVAGDMSSTALECVARRLKERPAVRRKVTLSQRPAHDFSDLPTGSFDTVVLNSVVQYFPDVDYLSSVLEGVVKLMARPSRIFIGDVRDKRSLEAFYASLELQQKSGSYAARDFRTEVQGRFRREEELVIHPGFFLKLKDKLGFSHVDILLKRAGFENEMSKFRYDAVLHFGEVEAVQPDISLDWESSGLEVPTLHRFLSDNAPQRVALRGVPNRRIWFESELVKHIAAGDGEQSLAEARAQVKMETAVAPEKIWEVAEGLGYEAHLGWFCSDAPDRFDAMLVKKHAVPGVSFPSQIASWSEVGEYATNPLKVSEARQFIAGLRSELKSLLPQQMLPAAYVVLDRIPLTANGKIAYDALPPPDDSRPQMQQPYAPPRNAVERVLADIWKDVLGMMNIGIHDSFFDLGGHSLSATRVVMRIREIFRTDFPLRTIFQVSTIAELSQVLYAAETLPGKTEKIANLLEKVRAMSDDELVSILPD